MTEEKQAVKSVIVCKADGPYIVKNVSRLISTQGQQITAKSTMALCRCGQSSNKPFCDGSHSKIDFSGDINPDTGKDRKKSYVGEKITIYDNRGLCAHAGVCTENLSAVFRMKQSPWIDPDQASVDEIKSVIDKCPSGALGYHVEGEQSVTVSRETEITVMPDGPYRITGEIEIEDVADFDGGSDGTRTLCRCGHSKNKPYCDGSHWDAGFKDA